MLALYNFVLPILHVAARAAAVFNPKLRRGLSGRANLQTQTREHYSKVTGSPRVLIHVASYGELEQAKPVIVALRKQYPNIHIHLTFFSPSGYDNVIGKYSDADLITYSPFDSTSDVQSFLDIVKPDIALFTRYDVWPNMALELARRNIPTLLFSATAAESSRRMMPLIRSLNRRVYNSLSQILVISKQDKALLASSGIDESKITIAGDTRFDQVISRKAITNNGDVLPANLRSSIERNNTLVFVLGSAWPEDEAIVANTIKKSIDRNDHILWIIAPHEPTDEHIVGIRKNITARSVRFSRIEEWVDEPVIIIDSIGKLFGLYQHADIAMIGGGFGAGLHNALEAAVWGRPVIAGPNHRKSVEVQAMIDALAAFEVKSSNEFDFVFWRLVNDEGLRQLTSDKARHFVENGQGATARIVAETMKLI